MSPVNVNSIGSYIREQREQAKISLRQLAQAAGISNPYLSQVERGLRRPSADILQQIAKGLRISAEALYVQAGILDEKRGESAVTDAIMADTEITDRQKQMLIDIYESFRKEVRAEAQASAEPAGEARFAEGPVPWDGVSEDGEEEIFEAEVLDDGEADPWAGAGVDWRTEAGAGAGADAGAGAGAEAGADARSDAGADAHADAGPMRGRQGA